MSDTLQILIFALIGMAAGLFSGLLGIGGGIITVPSLLFTFKLMHPGSSSPMRLAIGTSLAAMIFNTLSSSYAHYKKENVLFPIVKPMLIGIVFGALCGVLTAKVVSNSFLQMFFGIFECTLGIRFLLPQKNQKKIRSLPSFFGLSSISFCVSLLSTLLGIGGGLINVPILTHYHTPLRKAIGTSAVLSFVITLLGASFYLFIGHDSAESSQTGAIYLPAFLVIGIVAFFTAPWGVKLAHRLPTRWLKRVFGGVLIAAGLLMILGH